MRKPDGTWQERKGDIVWGCCLNLSELENKGLMPRTLVQTHGTDVHTDQSYTQDAQGDGLISDRANVALVIRTADCVPVHITDGHRIGILHAGWRGTSAGILHRIRDFFNPSNIQIVVGPSIHGTRYEVDSDLYEPWLKKDQRLAAYLTEHETGSSKRLFDLRGFVRHELLDFDIPAEAIVSDHACTYGSALPSYRREGKAAARIFNYIYRVSN